MSNNQKSGWKPSRLLITMIAALTVSAISLFYLNFFPSRESGIIKNTSPVKSSIVEKHPVYFNPESTEVVHPLQSVKNACTDLKPASPLVSLVNPPLPGMLPPSVEVIMENSKGGSLESAAGSVVVIPPGCFVDAKGSPVNDKVKVSFTEYRDYKDIFLSGIPMTYYTNNKKEQFESAGMMELLASTDNGQVYVNKNKRVRVMLAASDRSPDYNLYYFNKKKGNWEEKGKDKVTYKKKQLKRSAVARIMAPFTSRKRAVYISSFEGMPEDKVFLWWRTPGKNFDLSFIKISKSYPELKPLSGIQWEYTGADAKDVYARLFNILEKEKLRLSRRGYWDSYTAEMNHETVTMTLTFINDEESVPVTFHPKDRSERNLLRVKQRMEQYDKAIAERIASDNQDYANYQRDSTTYSYPDEAIAALSMDVMRSFEIDNFGIWNCDHIIDNDNYVSYTLSFYDQNNKQITPTMVYMADKNYNSVFTYYPNIISKQNGNTEEIRNCDMRLNPFSNCMIWMVLPGGKLAVAGQEEIWKLTGKKGKQKLIMKVTEDALASIEQVREKLNF